MPKVSILMITYNRERYIKDSLDSILNQNFKDFEIIIIDDCSSDKTSGIVNSYIKGGAPIVYRVNNRNVGISKSRNLALSLCSGEYVAVLDSDDVWINEDKLARQVDFLDNNKEYMVCGSMAFLINDNNEIFDKLVLKVEDKKIRKRILLSNQFVHSSVLYRKKIALSLGGYDDHLIGEDYDLFLKLGSFGKFFNFSEEMVKYRRHINGITSQKRKTAFVEHLKIIKKYKGKYPLYYMAIIKSYLRIIYSLVF